MPTKKSAKKTKAASPAVTESVDLSLYFDADLLDNLPPLIGVPEAAEILSLTPQSVARIIKRGDLVAMRPPGQRAYRIPRQAFLDYLASGFAAVASEIEPD